MQRIKLVLAIGAIIVAILIVSPLPPAMAAPLTDPSIYIPVPHQAGGTYSCTNGPPFVSKLDSPNANCTPQQSGAPAGLVCDIPTTITFVPAVPEVPGLSEYYVGGLLCH